MDCVVSVRMWRTADRAGLVWIWWMESTLSQHDGAFSVPGNS